LGFIRDTVKQVVAAQLKKLSAHERQAIWLQTPQGEDWECRNEYEREAYPVHDAEIIEYLVAQYIYEKAANWTNRRIRRYLEAR
jgi:hypothetical protein